MKLLRFGGGRISVLQDGKVYDATAAVGVDPTAWPPLRLEPGDIIATGTPAGVGPIRGGDTVTIEIERVGRMEIPVVQGQGGSNIAIKKEPAP